MTADYNRHKGDFNTSQSLADQFTNQSTTFLNQLNAHPDDTLLSTFGLNIFPLASKLGVAGIKLVTDHHFALARLRSDHRQHLLWSSVPYAISISPKPSGKLAIKINQPKRKFTLRWPDLNELRQCFYSLLSIAIVGNWKDHSKFTPDQIRFLMRLSGLKLINADQLCNDLRKSINKLNRGMITAQQVCHQLTTLFSSSNRGKLTVIINLLKEEALNDPKGGQPILLSKFIYVHHVLNRLPPAKRSQLVSQSDFSKLNQIPANDYLMMDDTYNWHSLSNRDVINFLNTLIFYLE